MIISVDFDGTCVTHEFPRTGKGIGAEIVLKALSEYGHKIICLSMRSDEHKDTMGIDTIKAIRDWFNENKIPLYGLNENPEQEEWSKSRKVYANLYIDDQFLGCPLRYVRYYSNRSFVDWKKVAMTLFVDGLLTQLDLDKIEKKLKEKYPDIYN